MEELSGVQLFITVLVSSGLIGGLATLITKRVWSPETKNDLARIGNEFAQQLLNDARAEREELRVTIKELEKNVVTKQESIDRLKKLLEEKDEAIDLCEQRHLMVARKIQMGQEVTLEDIFGEHFSQKFIDRYGRPKGESN